MARAAVGCDGRQLSSFFSAGRILRFFFSLGRYLTRLYGLLSDCGNLKASSAFIAPMPLAQSTATRSAATTNHKAFATFGKLINCLCFSPVLQPTSQVARFVKMVSIYARVREDRPILGGSGTC